VPKPWSAVAVEVRRGALAQAEGVVAVPPVAVAPPDWDAPPVAIVPPEEEAPPAAVTPPGADAPPVRRPG